MGRRGLVTTILEPVSSSSSAVKSLDKVFRAEAAWALSEFGGYHNQALFPWPTATSFPALAPITSFTAVKSLLPS
jgi:hypothetical protein